MQSVTNLSPIPAPIYTLELFAFLPDTSDASADSFEQRGPFPTLSAALDNAETLARDVLACRDATRLGLARIEVRAKFLNGAAGVVDALERDGGCFLWRLSTRERVRTEDPRERAERERSNAENVLRGAYFQSVRNYAEELARAVADGELADSSALDERLHETCDGSEHVIYTAKALDVLRWSDNDGAAFDELGAEALVSDDGMSYERLAYFALRADISEALQRFDASELGEFRARTLADFDPTDDDTFPLKRGEDAEDTAEEIRLGMARALHGLAWADCAETYRLANLSGCEILDVCGDPSEEAHKRASEMFERIERAERKRAGAAYSLAADFLARIEPEATSKRRSTAEDFGHCLALECLGHGAGWADDNPEHGLETPHADFIASFNGAAFGLSDDEMRERAAEAAERDPELSDAGQDDADGFTLPGHA